MALELRIWDMSLDAYRDLSNYQFHILYLNAEYTADRAIGGHQVLIGILQTKPNEEGKACEIRRVGISKVICGETIAVGDYITADTLSRGITAGLGQRYVGIALEPGVVGRYISIVMEFGFLPNVIPTPSVSASISPSISSSQSPSASVSPSISASVSASLSPSASISPSVSPSESPSASISASISPSLSPSASISPSVSPSLSPSASISPSISPSVSPSLSPSASISPSISPSA